MYRVQLNENQERQVAIDGENIFLDGDPFEWDMTRLSEHRYHIINDHRSYNAELIGFDQQEKTLTIKIEQQVYHILVKDRMTLLLEKMGISNIKADTIAEIRAPMPGLILDIPVNVGQTVKKGDQLMILEAMKMENILKSHGEGQIKSIEVSKGDSVEKNQTLIKF